MAKQPSLDDFRVPYFKHGKDAAAFRLDAFDPSAKPFSSGSKDADRDRLSIVSTELDVQQERLHTQQKKRVLLVLQGMDTSGKDGTVRAVFRDVDPLGLRIVPFKAPTPIEAAHDFLWRVHAQVPAAGELAIFNRSHYEDVLVPRVLGTIDDKECERRYRQIRDFETMLAENGTTIVKCFLHISKDEQRERLQARIDDPTKHWKFDIADLDARKHWDAYQAAYRDALAATSAEHAPWYVIPANSKTHRNVMIAELLLRAMTEMKLQYPPPKPELEGVKVR
ncbi:polyphosphate kinase 2 family protein [Burkholderia multivorans]|uniref:polyphosphate kinase 2 family protein n=1 Tax=Burkholderia TaxID=32008 RepID=UPI000D00CCC2|nr:polyphosphate kinase 2 family protein [Burkholderia multivorans]MBR8047551.1 polyphosphate kinase 2 family protein [Burkholderia multivorans]MBR8245000.1 polyphosphate kinase 2 family protein [Burkholderia multivorans]MBU9165521.1 polyphosphate kinase 2 family protein [Burkholderia multivorans]MCA8223349.1 polyphosphate kinase 2 family protein [Burkholderia multivorans]MDR9173841.1 Polyphosphate:AMP/ADP phosphotransferase [Burkholderia multivorans]